MGGEGRWLRSGARAWDIWFRHWELVVWLSWNSARGRGRCHCGLLDRGCSLSVDGQFRLGPLELKDSESLYRVASQATPGCRDDADIDWPASRQLNVRAADLWRLIVW